MYLLFKTVNDIQLGLVKRIGHYLDYVVGFLDDSIKDQVVIDHLNAVVIPTKEIAYAWKFAANYSGYLSVRAGTATNEQLELLTSTEPTGEKVKYYLTDEDRANAVAFMKIALRKILDEVYDKRLQHVKLEVSELEFKTWNTQLNEANSYNQNNNVSTPMLTALAQVRGITVAQMASKVIAANAQYTERIASLLANKQIVEKEVKDCTSILELNVVIHNRFGYNMPAKQQQDMGISHGSIYNL